MIATRTACSEPSLQGFATFADGDSPLIAVAPHHGHALRPEVADLIRLDDRHRLREEDPFTGHWTAITDQWAIGHRSRFEVDLNRPPDKAVYREPADAWGLEVWKTPPSPAMVERSLALYHAFYRRLQQMVERTVAAHGRVVVYDLHTYNHRRAGAGSPVAPEEENPEVNVGTGTMDRSRWSHVVDRFITDLSNADFLGRRLDVRENVRFRGGNISRWLHQAYADSVCSLSIEVKKFFMDEWTGQADPAQLAAVGQALSATVAGAVTELQRR